MPFQVDEKLHYVYKIVNMINSKEYIGIHSQNVSKKDDYYGSGKLIGLAIEKYGIENFSKEIIFIGNDRDEIVDFEKSLVNEDYVSMNNTYNLVVGGGNPPTGCWKGKNHTKETKLRIRNSKIGKCTGVDHWTKDVVHEQTLNKVAKNLIKISFGNSYAKGHKKTYEQKEIEKLRNLGKRWCTNGELEIFSFECPDGYRFGRNYKRKGIK